MAQLYNPTLSRLIRTLLLQCVIMLGLVSVGMAQATLPINHDGPWRNYSGDGWTVSGLSADGPNLAPSSAGGSAQFRIAGSSIVINIENIDSEKLAQYRLSYSLKASATTNDYTADFNVSYSSDGNTYEPLRATIRPSYNKVDMLNDMIPGSATHIKFELTSVSKTYVFFDALAITQEPVITGFTPNTDAPGRTITISGLLFNDATSVSFGEVEATIFNVTDNSGTSITATVPNNAVSGKIKVVTPAGVATSTNSFTVRGPQLAAVAANQFSPTAGDIGNAVTINGIYFTGVDSVFFNGVYANFTIVSDAVITAVVPVGASKGKITVSSPAGSVVSTNDFDVNAPRFIAADVDGTMRTFSPTIGGVGTEITIYGINLSSVTGVKFLGAAGTEDDRTSQVIATTVDNQLKVIAPANAATGPIMLITADGKEVTSEEIFNFVPAPIIASFSPAFGIAGDLLTITGENFQNTTIVKVGNVELAPYVAETNETGFRVNAEGTEITVNVPADAVTAKVYVTTELGGTAESENAFVIVQAPEYVSMTPTAYPVGKTVTITGKYFTGVTKVTFMGTVVPVEDEEGLPTTPNAVDATTFTVVSDTEIIVTVPENAQTGKISIVNQVGKVESTEDFTVIIAPVIAGFSPTTGVVGTEVTITGYNFTGLTEVKFGETPVLAKTEQDPDGFEVISDSEILVRVPVGAVTSKITVITADGNDVSEADFVVIQAPTIAETGGISPLRGVVGDIVTIIGENLGDVTRVSFLGLADTEDEEGNPLSDDVIVTSFESITATEIKVKVPAGAVSGNLMVTNVAGSATSAEAYEVITAPELISFNPTSGKVGDDVVISGWVLGEAVSVEFNGTVQNTIFVSPDGKTITAKVPTGATTGQLTVNFPEDFKLVSEGVYTVIPLPTIVSFNPESGVAETAVRIVGTNFTTISKVTFNGVDADISGIDVTVAEESTEENPLQQFTVLVPTNATTGKISLTAVGGTATSETDFTVPVPAEITFIPTTSYANEVVTIKGKYFKNVSAITFNGNAATIVGALEDEIVEGVPTGFQTITVKAPFDAGTGVVAITTPAGRGISTAEYTVIEPVIVSVTTVDGKNNNQGYAGRTLVTLTGTNFMKYFNENSGTVEEAAPVVTLAGQAMTLIAEETSDTKVSFLLPTNANSGQLLVRSLSGISVGIQFSVLAPTITSINPNPAYTGQVIEVRGDNFIGITGVTYNGDAVTISNLNEQEVNGSFTFIAPIAKSDPVNGEAVLTVTSNSGSDISNFAILKPTISSIVKTRDYTGQDPVRTVAINGANFIKYWDGNAVAEQNPAVRFTGAANDANIISATDNQLVVQIPTDAATGKITVTTANGSAESTTFTVIGSPTITNFTRTADIEGAPVTINGTFFDEAVKVTFVGAANDASDDKEVLKADFVSNTILANGTTRIVVRVPEGANNGRITVTNLNTTNNTGTSSTDFRVVKVPVIENVTATSGKYSTTVTMTGQNLADVNSKDNGKVQVYFTGHGGTWVKATVDNYNVWDATQITFKIPANSITGKIKVVNEAAPAGVLTEEDFIVTSPLIVSFEHKDGRLITTNAPARINEPIVVRGYRLSDIGTVSFKGATATSFLEKDATNFEVTVPRNAETGKVTLNSEVEGAMTTTVSTMDVIIAQPSINLTPAALSFSTEPEKVSVAQPYNFNAANLIVGEEAMSVSIVAGSQPFEMSLDGIDYVKALTFEVQPDGSVPQTTVYVRYGPAESGFYSAVIRHEAPFSATVENLALTGNSVTPLPVELIAFNARKEGNSVQLTWATASELDNDYFVVQMTEDLKGEFKAVGKVKSKVNTTSLRQDYQFNHKGNFNGTRYYRLKQVDLDGTFEYSKVVAVSSNGVNLAVGPRVYPNPINADSKLVYNADRAGKLNVRIVNMNGSAVQNLSYDIEEGENTILLNLNNNLPTGIYILMTEFNGKTEQVKLMKQ